jgi:hypothetical protein
LRRLADALIPARLHTLLKEGAEEGIRQVDDSIAAATHASQSCPYCEVYEHADHGAVCLSCRGFLSEGLLKALRRIPDLPEILPNSSPGMPARGAAMARRDASSSLSGSRLYGVA